MSAEDPCQVPRMAAIAGFGRQTQVEPIRAGGPRSQLVFVTNGT
jgi:hypothetical protein